MLTHYLKVAFRNMWKYRNQTLVSVAGLAVGFVCFAMAALWIRYEMTYDSFHKNADRMYCVYRPNIFFPTVIAKEHIPAPLAGYLKSIFPEIANATAVSHINTGFEYEGVKHKADFLYIDSSFFKMFDVRIVEGSMDFLIPGIKKIAVTQERALQMFGNESPVDKQIEILGDFYKICAVISGLPKRSNYPFDFLEGIHTSFQTDDNGDSWYDSGNMLVELVPGIDMEVFEKKLNEHKVQLNDAVHIENIRLVPLTEMHYKDPSIKREVKFQHIIIFALAGLLLILCTLFNYLTLFFSRFRMRQRELALRVVYGASGRSLFAMLSIEFLISLTAALISGLVLINILRSSFLKVSGARLDLSAIYLESIIYMAGVIATALTVFFLMLVIFRRRTLNASMRSNKKILRKVSIVVQLIISIVFAFCTLIILKQMYYLHNSVNLGFSFKNRGSVEVGIEEIEVLSNKMKQIPEIKETVTGHFPLLPIRGKMNDMISDCKQDGKGIEIEYKHISEQYAKFYEFKLIEGEFVRDDDDEKYVLINELAAKAFGWDKSAGKSFCSLITGEQYIVKGVLKNIYNFSPAIAAEPCYFQLPNSGRIKRSHYLDILFKYEEGSWQTCMKKITKIIEKEFPHKSYLSYCNMEEEYNKYLKSENALLAILTVVSLVCLMVCVFGFVSMVSLTCEERRKEIAIRKVNGATIKDILDIFFKEHLTLLAIGALIAFPVGYIIMKRWLQQSVIQTEISAWIYVAILLALSLVIIMCVGGRVYKTSRENPVNALNR
ncbi:MAG: ABC transporter permease [Prevotellaceae bacterium]|jgi:heme/copper-type cytochrome/quinol oxidase subunit 2|nr:ABC transporter permease [Prevotellaceae bacterium]